MGGRSTYNPGGYAGQAQQRGDWPAIAPILEDALLGLLRLAHALAAALWVGGALIYVLAGRAGPAAEGEAETFGSPPRDGPVDTAARGSTFFRGMLGGGVAVFVLSGTVLAFQRLSSAPLPPLYLGLLAIKIGLGGLMFLLARQMGSNAARPLAGVGPAWQLAVLGIVIYGLAIALRSIYEEALRQ